MKTEEISIEGMTCGHCVMSVRKELTKLPNIIVEEVQISSARIKYDGSDIIKGGIVQAIENAGYTVVTK